MLNKRKLILVVIISVLILTLMIFFAQKQKNVIHRDPNVLLNQFYKLQKSNPEAAKQSLEIILEQDADNLTALKELVQINLKEKKPNEALPWLEHLHELLPQDINYTRQLAYLYFELGQWQDSRQLFTKLAQNKSVKVQKEARVMLKAMSSYIPSFSAKPNSVLQILLDQYYDIRNSDPENARLLLSSLHELAPENSQINRELGYDALQRGDKKTAIDYFETDYAQNPTPQIALQLGYLHQAEHNKNEAARYFLLASQTDDLQLKRKALAYFQNIEARPSETPGTTEPVKMSRKDSLFNQYYALRKHNKSAAWNLIQQIIREYPTNVVALKEGGYLAVELNHNIAAIDYFTRAYLITSQAELAMQLGYLYNKIDNNYLSYQYFKLATHTQDKTLELKAQNALTNLAGLQTKVFPKPYFSEIFFEPFSQSRFGLTVRPIVARLGIELRDYYNTKVYSVFRQTDDNRSRSLGQISQIYDDNVRIIGAGVQVTPIPRVPLIAFVEAGGAYDLVYRFRPRWRGDLRSTLMYFNEFGKRPAYYDKPTVSTDYYSTLYGDTSYFSRYDNNVITTLKTYQGIRLLQYHSSMLNLYVTGRTIFDTNRDFYNNIAEIGPGISIVPSNRFNLMVRFERINGVYLPVGNSLNPYGKYYTNNIVQLLLYVKL